MRTSVSTNPHDIDETDEFPGCAGNVEDDGSLVISEHPSGDVETVYEPGKWVDFTTTAKDED